MQSNRIKLLALGAIGALAVIVVALGVVFVAMRGNAPHPASGTVAIAVSDATCQPGSLTVTAGTPEFAVTNTSNRAIEWEILDGVLVLAERENILPGSTVNVTPRLDPGNYQMTCGLLSNPHGTLTVTASNGGTTALPTRPQLADLVAPTAEYRVYAIGNADQLATASLALETALKAGDMAAARTHAGEAVTALAHIAPVAHLYADAVAPLTSGPTALPALAKSLDGTTPASDAATLADAATKSAAGLGGAVHSTTAAPHEIVAGAGTVVADLAKGFDDPAVAAARVAGVRKVVDLFRPLTLRADKALSAKLDGDLTAVEDGLKGASPDAKALQPRLTDLGADMTDLLSALGLNQA